MRAPQARVPGCVRRKCFYSGKPGGRRHGLGGLLAQEKLIRLQIRATQARTGNYNIVETFTVNTVFFIWIYVPTFFLHCDFLFSNFHTYQTNIFGNQCYYIPNKYCKIFKTTIFRLCEYMFPHSFPSIMHRLINVFFHSIKQFFSHLIKQIFVFSQRIAPVFWIDWISNQCAHLHL